MNNEEIITELSSLWYNIVGSDHHKDRDCHWYINKVWSYGDKPFYRVEHYGYVYSPNEIAEDKFRTLQGAEKCLIFHMLEAIDAEYSWNIEHQDEPNEYDLHEPEIVESMRIALEKYKEYRTNEYH
jgi:hypothetical protein